jgi:hypothetical protein
VDLEGSDLDSGAGTPAETWAAPAHARRLPILDRHLWLHLVVGVITTTGLFFTILLVTKH